MAKITKGYGLNNPLQDIFPNPVIATRDPTTSDKNYPLGQDWVNKSDQRSYKLLNVSAGSATWGVMTPGASDVDTLTGDTGGAISPVVGNINIVGGDGLSVAGSGNTLTINRDAEGGYPITPYVVGPAGQAGYQTIQSALDAANGAGGGMVWVQGGTYTEDLTFYDNIQLVGDSESATLIIGTHTPPTSGSLNIFRVKFQDATAIFSSGAAGTTTIICEDTAFEVTNGFTFTLPNWTGSISLFDIAAEGTNDGFINNTGGASLNLFEASVGVGSGQTMITSGAILFQASRIGCPVNMQTGSVFTIDISQFSKTITLSNDSAGSFSNCKFSTGSSAAITMSSSGSVNISTATINSTNDPAITGSGAGILKLTDVSFTGNYNVADTVVLSSGNIRGGNFLSQFVVALDGTAPYTVIQDAMDAAQTLYVATGTPQVVYVKPGAYTEDLTFYDGVDLHGALGQVDSGFLTVTGVHSLPTSGIMSTYGIWYIGDTACFTASSGTTKVNMFNVITSITGVGYTFDIDGFAGEINIFDFLQFDGGTNGFVNNPTGACEVNIIFAGVGLTQDLTATAQISGSSFFQGMLVSINMNFVGSGTTYLNMGCELQGTISTADSANVNIANTYCFVGTGKAINHLSSGTVTLSNVGVTSSNATPIDGTGNITLTNVGFTNTFAIAGTLTVTSGPTRTGALLSTGPSLLNAGTGNDLTFQMGDNAGVNKVSFTDSDAVEVFAVDSNGDITFSTLSITGNFAQTGGTFNVGQDNAANAINIGGGNVARAIAVGNSAAAHTIEIGSDTGAASLDLKAGTGNFTLDGATATTYSVGSSTTSGTISIGGTSQTGTITLGSSDGTSTVAIASGSGASTVAIAGGTGGNTVTLADGAGANSVTIGSTNTTSSLTLQSGTGGITTTGTFVEINAKQINRTGADITFKSSPLTCTAADTGGAATGTTGATNLLSFAQGIVMEQFIIGAGQTIIKPVMDTSGLLCSLDLVNTEGVEYNFGAARTLSEYAFTIGTSAAFFFEVEMTLADISGGNPYFIGFRKAAANNGTYTSYTDYYALGMNAVTSATNLTLASELNSGGTTLQDSGTAWTGGDGGTVTMKVLVSAAGVVTATIDGGAPVTPLVYTFDSTDVVCPFIHLVHNADAAAVHLVSMKVGFQ